MATVHEHVEQRLHLLHRFLIISTSTIFLMKQKETPIESIQDREIFQGTMIDLNEDQFWNMTILSAKKRMHIDEYALKVLSDHIEREMKKKANQ